MARVFLAKVSQSLMGKFKGEIFPINSLGETIYLHIPEKNLDTYWYLKFDTKIKPPD